MVSNYTRNYAIRAYKKQSIPGALASAQTLNSRITDYSGFRGIALKYLDTARSIVGGRQHIKQVTTTPVPQLPPPSQHITTFVTDAFFLKECRDRLCADEKEDFLYSTGARKDGFIVLSTKLTPRKRIRSLAGVHIDSAEVLHSLMFLEKKGFKLNGVFHSHPGYGIPYPSSVDMRLHRTLERDGYTVIGGVFTPQGVTFYSDLFKFNIYVEGSDVEKRGENTFVFK